MGSLKSAVVAGILMAVASTAWSSGLGHGSGHHGDTPVHYDPARDRQAHLESLQSKIERVEKKLENPGLKPAKRKKRSRVRIIVPEEVDRHDLPVERPKISFHHRD